MIKTKIHGNVCELIGFRRRDEVATIATNGERHVVQMQGGRCIEFKNLREAIASLASRGWQVDPGLSRNF